jgi:YebC/PmpR family DNA-binding regulatory protein
MSGHSKWSTIKHQKAATDIKRGKAFSKVAKLISVAVKEGGSPDPEANAKLRLAIDQAKSVNMPKDNIKRAIERGLGKSNEAQLETIIYEGFGPANSVIIVECVTDNKNRTAADVKSFFDRGGGNIGAPGSAAYLFEKKGQIMVDKHQDTENQILKLMDLGIDDIEEEDSVIVVYTDPQSLEAVKDKIKNLGFGIKGSSLNLKPKTTIKLEDKTKQKKLLDFLSNLEDLEDVQKVYCNVDFNLS